MIYAAKQGATVTRVPLHELRYDLVALAAAVGPKTKIVYVCHPNNPTGTMNTRAELDDFLDRLPDGVLTVVDQAYFEYIDHDGYPDAVAEYFLEGRRVVVLRTFSKIYGLAGARVGYAVGPHDVCAAMAKVRRPFDLTTTAQAAALASVDDVGEIARRRDLNTQGLIDLRAILERHGLEPAAGAVGNFLYVDLGEDAAPLFERLLLQGVIVRPLAGFGEPNAIRVSVGAPDEHEFLDAALGRAARGCLSQLSGATASSSATWAAIHPSSTSSPEGFSTRSTPRMASSAVAASARAPRHVAIQSPSCRRSARTEPSGVYVCHMPVS